MTAQERLIQTAQAEVGYLEKASNAQLDDKTANAGSKNYTKYARDLDAISGFYNGRKQGSSWCDVFVDWCFVQTFGVEDSLALLCQPKGSCGAGVLYSARYFQAKDRLMTSPQVGDQIFFGTKSGSTITKGNHTGIVYKVDTQKVYTIEGNTSGASGVVSNGGGVCEKWYYLSNKNIIGYGRPDWTLAKEEIEMTEQEVKAYVDQAVQGVAAAVNVLRGELTEPVYNTVAECPEWAKTAVQWAVDCGYIVGDGTGRLGLDAHKLWGLQVMYNVMTKGGK